jgi:hypothetical protein
MLNLGRRREGQKDKEILITRESCELCQMFD